MKRTHGGDWVSFIDRYGTDPLDFSANISPLGLPESVRAAIAAALTEADRYPDRDCRALRAALAAHESIPELWLLCGNGAADLIWRAVLAAKPKHALLTVPCFSEYEAALKAGGCEIRYWPLTQPFILTEQILSCIDRDLDLMILCNPNNPTGCTIEADLLRRIVRRCEETGVRLLLDECFIDFLEEPEHHTAKTLLESSSRLLILRAFTKFYGLAGVRLGYGMCADRTFLTAMDLAGPPWSVSALAQAAGLAALGDRDYAERLRTLIRTERSRLKKALEELDLRVIPGEANFLLFSSDQPLTEPLAARGVLIRSCGDFRGLDECWYRVGVRTREDNDRLIEVLREVLT